MDLSELFLFSYDLGATGITEAKRSIIWAETGRRGMLLFQDRMPVTVPKSSYTGDMIYRKQSFDSVDPRAQHAKLLDCPTCPQYLLM